MIIECPHWIARHFLATRILYAWSREPPWPARGIPVAVTLYLPLAELNHKKSISNFVEKVSSRDPSNDIILDVPPVNLSCRTYEKLFAIDKALFEQKLGCFFLPSFYFYNFFHSLCFFIVFLPPKGIVVKRSEQSIRQRFRRLHSRLELSSGPGSKASDRHRRP